MRLMILPCLSRPCAFLPDEVSHNSPTFGRKILHAPSLFGHTSNRELILSCHVIFYSELDLPPDAATVEAAVVRTVVGSLAVLQAIPGLPPLDEGSVLCLPPLKATEKQVVGDALAGIARDYGIDEVSDKSETCEQSPPACAPTAVDDAAAEGSGVSADVLAHKVQGPIVVGRVAEVFGPVTLPNYSLRFANEAALSSFGLTPGLKLFALLEHSSYLSTQSIRQASLRGSDASGNHDEVCVCGMPSSNPPCPFGALAMRHRVSLRTLWSMLKS